MAARSSAVAAAGRSVLSDGKGRNPFTLPSDEDLFMSRERGRAAEMEQRKRAGGKRVWDRVSRPKEGMLRKLREETTPGVDEEAKEKIARTQSLVAAATAAMTSTQRREREQLTSFISKKREMFLLQMALDTKREEIQKLEHKAQMKEEALKKSELMLEEDAIRFDAFLKENDRLAHSAMKAAEEATKKKQGMQQEIKKLKYQIQALKGENAKNEDTLKEWKGYQRFLDDLTDQADPEWKGRQQGVKRGRQMDRKRAKWGQDHAQWTAAREAKQVEIEEEEAARKEQCRRTGKLYKAPHIPSVLDEIFAGWPEPRLDDEAYATESSGEDLPMFFTRPAQLLQLFADKEERNLFLITNKQEIEHQLEELRQEYTDTQAAMERQTRALEDSRVRLQDRIAVEEAKMAALSERIAGGSKGDESQVLLAKLEQRIADVYAQCGGDLTSKPGPITMLTRLEGDLEALLARISGLPPDYVKDKERAMEDERRKILRVEKAAAEAADIQRRLENSIRRSQEPVKKRVGKPLMAKSRPVRKKKAEETVDPAKLRELADMKYFV